MDSNISRSYNISIMHIISIIQKDINGRESNDAETRLESAKWILISLIKNNVSISYMV